MQKINSNAGKKTWYGRRLPEVWTHEGAYPKLLAEMLREVGFEVEIHTHAKEGYPTSRIQQRFDQERENIISDPNKVIFIDSRHINKAREKVENVVKLAQSVYVPYIAEPDSFEAYAEDFKEIIAGQTAEKLQGYKEEQKVFEVRKQQGKETVALETTLIPFDFANPFMALWSLSNKEGEDRHVVDAPNLKGLREAGKAVFGAATLAQKNALDQFQQLHGDGRIPITVIPCNRIGRIEGETRKERRDSQRLARFLRDGTYHPGQYAHGIIAAGIAQHIIIVDEESGRERSLFEMVREKRLEKAQQEKITNINNNTIFQVV